MSDLTAQAIATDDRLWTAYARGWAEGLRCGYADGYQAGAADEAAAETAEWAALRKQMDQVARDHGILERRATYATPAKTALQIQAQARWSWRQAEREIQAKHMAGTG